MRLCLVRQNPLERDTLHAPVIDFKLPQPRCAVQCRPERLPVGCSLAKFDVAQ